ncbi:Gamma-tubulin complex component 6 [Stylophora pistillata]|uniref:Gamma-tubulin complex component 6 n=1 Tax=Stylophora pistillata TaxID=50429 RepID=A0A2B4SKQ0_STYPI|nr:Gamma-tubulin complex component 6 [Stylophora pistillata]
MRVNMRVKCERYGYQAFILTLWRGIWRNMADECEGFSFLFSKLCELSFQNKANIGWDIYRRPRYTDKRQKALKVCLYETLFEELRAPWISELVRTGDGAEEKDGLRFNVYDKLSIAAFKLRLARRFDDVEKLDHFVCQWKNLQESPSSAIKFNSTKQTSTTEKEAVLRFLVALTGTGLHGSTSVLGHQDDLWARGPYQIQKTSLPEGPLLVTDSQLLRQQGLEFEHYIHYSRELFECLPVLSVPGSDASKGKHHTQLQNANEDLYEKNGCSSLFSALVHSHTDDLQVKLDLPDIPSNSRTLYSLALERRESADDEGFESLETSSESSLNSEQSTQENTDVWSAALALPPQKFYTWEMEGKRELLHEKPYLTEAGPAVFDALYDTVIRQVSYIVKSPTLNQANMVPLQALIKDSINVLIGVPSRTFHLDKPVQSFIVSDQVRLSGTSPEMLRNILARLAAIGTDYIQLNKFATHHRGHSAGLVLQAFLGALQSYLQCYRATVLSVEGIPLPKMEVTFSMHRLSRIEAECKLYMTEIQKMHRQLQEQRENERKVIEDEREREIVEERERAAKALAEITELIQKAKEAVEVKKREDLNMLKEQMEEAFKHRALAREQEKEEDIKRLQEVKDKEVTTATVEDEMKNKAREELIKYYEELSREVEYREFRAQWDIRRRLLDSARAQFLVQEQARLDSLQEQLTQASGTKTFGEITNESDVRHEKKFEEKSVFKEERASTPISALSPSLVSLIASGVKTDALVRAEHTNLGERTQFHREDASQAEESALENKVRRTWDSPAESAAELGKMSEAGSGRKTWEAPPDGEVKIASSLPKSHPSDSSIQFAMYSDKGKGSEESETLGYGLQEGDLKTCAPHIGDSSLQNVLYPSTPSESTSGLDAESVNMVTRPSDLSARGLAASHPSDSSAQDVLYGSATGDASEVRTPSAQGHPSDSTAQHLLKSGASHGETISEARSSEHGHPSDSSLSGLLYPHALNTPNSQTPRLIQHGHPSDSQVSFSHGDSVSQVIQHSSRQNWQHPSDASIQKLLGDIDVLGESQNTTRGIPPSSVAQDILYPKPDGQSTPYTPHTSRTALQSEAQDILYPMEEDSEQSDRPVHTRGAPPQSVIQNIMYSSGEGAVGEETRLSTRGQEPAGKIKNILYYVKEKEGEVDLQPQLRQLEFEDVWLASQVEPLQDKFDVLEMGTLDFLELRYRVDWPLNIVITEKSVVKYNKIFSFMLRLKRLSWVLRDIWFHLKHVANSRNAAGSPQLRQLQLFRHEMQHFVHNLEGYLSNQILNVTWSEFQEGLLNVRSLDDLHNQHSDYLRKAIFRSLLSRKAAPVMTMISDLGTLILKLRTQLLASPWQLDPGRGHLTHPAYDIMCNTHKVFKEYSTFLFTAVVLMGRNLRTKLDILKPNIRKRVEEKRQDQGLRSSHNPTRQLPVGQAVVARNYRTGDKWVPGIITAHPGPLSYEVRDGPNTVRRRHIDQLKETAVTPSVNKEYYTPHLDPAVLVGIPPATCSVGSEEPQPPSANDMEKLPTIDIDVTNQRTNCPSSQN